MSAFLTHKRIGEPKTLAKSIVAVIALSLLICIFIGILQSISTVFLGDPVTASASISTEIVALSEQIKHHVKGLGYSDKVAEDFSKMVIGWTDEHGESVLAGWRKELDQAQEDHEQGRISNTQLAQINESIARQLSERIKEEIGLNDKFFDLADIIKHKQTQCLGSSQFVYILGNSIGLLIKPIDVPMGAIKLENGQLAKAGHIACMICLPDDRKIIIDLAALPGQPVSAPFIMENEFIKIGDYWQLKDKDNPLGIHKRIKILDNNGLIAGIYYNRANEYYRSGRYRKAIAEYTKAIELCPRFAEAYYSRGGTYERLGQCPKALSDYTKAIEFNPEFSPAYNNRGRVYAKLGQFTKAVSDFTKTIKLNPEDIETYYNRGYVYDELHQYAEAISDYTATIKLMQKYRKPDSELSAVYSDRGLAYALWGKREKATEDLLKADRLNPALKPRLEQIAHQYKLYHKHD